MANFVYSFDTGLYDTSNHTEDGYPWKSGPVPIGGHFGFAAGHHGHSPLTAVGTGEYYKNARLVYNGHTGSVTSPLSDMNGGVQYLTGGDLGTHADNKGATGSVIGVLYNYVPTASAVPGNDKYFIFRLPTFGTDNVTHTTDWHYPCLRLSAKYQNNTKIALVTNTNETIIYTVPKTYVKYTAINPDGWTTAGLSGKDLAVGPNLRRKVALGYV
tara:strand:+ start:81 stop:722 length:642 start_codon:yes stop_codon:yes gene_type:complete